VRTFKREQVLCVKVAHPRTPYACCFKKRTPEVELMMAKAQAMTSEIIFASGFGNNALMMKGCYLRIERDLVKDRSPEPKFFSST